MTYKLSPSSLNLMLDCPRCFWLQMVKKIRRPAGPMSSIPIKMDSIIKKYFDKYREQNQLPPIIRGLVKGKLAKGMPKTLYFEKSLIALKGLPDEYLELEDGNIVAFDHKTKSKPPEETHPSYQLQLDIYTFLLKMNKYKTTNKAYLAYYYPCDCDIHDGLDVHCKIMEIKTNPERAIKLVKQAERILNGKIPEARNGCGFCGWVEKLK